MRLRNLLLSLIFVAAASWPLTTAAAQPTEVVMFYGQGCPHCALMESRLLQLQAKYPTLEVTNYEVYNDRENILLMKQYTDAYGIEISGVPTLFVGRRAIVGNQQSLVESEVANCVQNGCPDPSAIAAGTVSLDPRPAPPTNPEPDPLPPGLSDGDPAAGTTEPNPTEPSPEKPPAATIDPIQPEIAADEPINPGGRALDAEEPSAANNANPLLPAGLTIPAVISGAAVDAINPCAFAVLILLMTTVLATGNRRRALLAGLAFSVAIFLSYLMMGLGLFSAIQSAGVSRTFYVVIGVLAVLIGLFNLKDYLWYGKWFIMEVPLSWRPRLKSLIKGVTSVPGAFGTGVLVSLFLLPCTSGPYIVILGMLAGSATRAAAIPLLVLYNAIFVLPMVVITLAVSFGAMSTEKAEAWRQRRLKHLHLIAGAIILTLGVIMLVTAGTGH
jgi:cytochrome c biogenesis protein CcdA/glutaredoxin